MPLISVIMSIHNGSKTVSRAIESILEQTIQDFEIIICDDCSTDNTLDVLQDYAVRDRRVRVLRNDTNLGLALSLNNCIKEARGQFVARMDDDDISLPTRFERQVTFLNEHEKYGYVSSNAISFDDSGDNGIIIRPENPQKKDFLKGTPYIHPATMFRTLAIKKVNGYSEKEYARRRAQDYDLFMRLYANGIYGYNIQDPLIKYYISKSTAVKKRTIRSIIDEMNIRFNGFREIGFPAYYYVFVLVPLFVYCKQKVFIQGE